MDVKEIIDTLNNSPRFGRPEAAKTIVITAELAREIVRKLQESKVRYKNKRHEGRIEGARPQ